MLGNPSEFNKFFQNPLAYMASKKANIPDGMTDPNQILQHLLLTGQIPQDAYNWAMNKKREMEKNGQMPTPPNGFLK